MNQNQFKKFIELLEGNENIFVRISNAIKYIADEIHIDGVYAKSSILMNKKYIHIFGKEKDIELDKSYTYKKVFNTNGIDTEIVISRLKDKDNWSESEIISLNILTKIIYMYLEKDKLIEFIEKAKNTDSETGTPNFNGFNTYFNKVFRDGKAGEYANLFFNIKNFKLVNSEYGREKSNDILFEYTRVVNEFVGENGIVARLGGDNYMAAVKKDILDGFIGLLTNTKLSFANKQNEHIECELGARAGVYVLTGEERVPGQALGKSTTAFSICKRINKNDILFYDAEIEAIMIREKQLEKKIEPALKNNEFFVVYQPKVNIETYEIVGAEALVRWNDHGRIIPPFQFVPVCEENGLICELDLYVLESVCKEIRRWLDEKIEPVKVSVNFSKKHFRKKDTTNNIMKIVNKYNVPPSLLEIEFTETAYIDEYDNLVYTLNELKEEGIGTSMDDFGVGYSSINLLQDLEFDVLKIDRSFLLNQENKRNRIIYSNIVKMSKELSMDVISEGVETKEHVEFLKEIGCNKVQGYFFDKPLEIEEFEKRLTQKVYNT